MSGITTAELHKLWVAVQDKPEWATTKFWEYVFKQNVFSGHEWAIASQQPPTEDADDGRRVDLVVENIGDNYTLLFMEAKRANVTRDLIEEVEYQAFTACCAHLHYTGREAIWAMTCIGSRSRIWAYHAQNDYLTEFWPAGDGLSERTEYSEFSTQGRDLLKYLDYVKKNPVPDPAVFSNPPSPRPARVALPLGWHDREVAFISAPGPSQIQAGSSGASIGYQPTTQAQSQGISQGATLPPAGWLEVVVVKFDDNEYKCERLLDRKRVHVPWNEWSECTIDRAGQVQQAFCWTGNSGTTYYTWSLDSERRKGKKVKR